MLFRSEIDDPDDEEQSFAGRLYAPLRQRGHSKEGRDNQPQVIIALAVTRGGMPVKSWVLPGNTADVTTVARIKDDLRSLKLGRCVFVGDAGMYSAANLEALSRGLGRYILAVPMRKVKDIDLHVLTNRSPYKTIADNLQAKEVWVGDGERRKRYVLCLNQDTEKRDRERRAQRIRDLEAELALLEKSKADHPKAACALLTSRRYGRYLSKDDKGRLQLDQTKISEAEKFDGKFVVISNDDTLSMEDIALGYKGGWIIEIDQSWGLSRIRVGCFGRVGWRRQASPGRGRCTYRFERRDSVGIGMNKFDRATSCGRHKQGLSSGLTRGRLDKRPFCTQL